MDLDRQGPSDAVYLDLYMPKPMAQQQSCCPAQSPVVSRGGKRLSLQVSSELHRQLKILAMEDEETMNSLIVGVLRRYIRERSLGKRV
jgi:hypothetical protein